MRDIWIYIAVMSAVTIAIRLIPALLLRRPIRNGFVRSFLFYVPYVTLAVMTFPAIVEATRTPYAGAAAFAFAIFLAWNGANLFRCAAGASIMVLIIEGIVFSL
ncbi:AzlD domain-containing protein [Selenomonas massiliensis]|uniref:AzlD domain-containing protein n=1 Tax=Selenomonas massiliensis TaxID=2058293 RepID=UPI000D0F0C21|nr:AzlD domain-containing protein [Selenomonas massiliensis]